MIRRPPRSTLDRSSAASDVYKRQAYMTLDSGATWNPLTTNIPGNYFVVRFLNDTLGAVSYTHLRAHETVLDLVCRLLLEKKKN